MALYIGDLKISSPAFEYHAAIPTRYTGAGDGVSPPLAWSGAPEGTHQFAIVCHDADAPLPHGWTHWVVVGIPPEASEIPESACPFVEATNDFGDVGYGAPLPPPGHGVHHYYFWVYALSVEIDADERVTRAQLLDRAGEHVIEQARLIGTVEQ